MAREDDRQRVAVHDRPHRPRRARARRTRRQLSVGHDLAVRDAGELAQDAPVEVGLESEVDRQVEPLPLAFEVLVELAPRGIDRDGRAKHAQPEGVGEKLELALGLGVIGDAA